MYSLFPSNCSLLFIIDQLQKSNVKHVLAHGLRRKTFRFEGDLENKLLLFLLLQGTESRTSNFTIGTLIS